MFKSRRNTSGGAGPAFVEVSRRAPEPVEILLRSGLVVRVAESVDPAALRRLVRAIGTCIAHDLNPRRYLHLVTNLIVHGWPQAKLRDLLPDRMLLAHPELHLGERASPALAQGPPALPSLA